MVMERGLFERGADVAERVVDHAAHDLLAIPGGGAKVVDGRDVEAHPLLGVRVDGRHLGAQHVLRLVVTVGAPHVRGAVEHDVPVVSATQTTRSGYGNSDIDLTDTSESFGLPATADLMLALISTEELEQSGRIMVKQLKNRYNDLSFYKRFTVGIDRAKMKLYNVDDSEATESILDAAEEDTYEQFETAAKQNRLSKFSDWT